MEVSYTEPQGDSSSGKRGETERQFGTHQRAAPRRGGSETEVQVLQHFNPENCSAEVLCVFPAMINTRLDYGH